jgi:hypothetical protein
MLRFLCLLGVLSVAAGAAQAQVFNCSVAVNTSALNRSDVAFLDDLGDQITRYYNDRAWTNDRFEPIERITCNIQIQFTASVSQTRFRANFTLSTRRPIYGTLASTNVLQTLSDQNWEFEFVPGTQLTFDARRYDALASLLDFYAYLALGYDYDTFGRLGGTPYFEQAREIVQVAQAAGQWQPTNSAQDRTALITQLLDPRFQPLRVAYADLHLGALDRFVDNPETARQAVLTTLQNLRALHDEVSKQYALEVLFLAKGAEIVDIMERAPQRTAAYELLIAMDPGRPSVYNRLLN